MKNLVIWAIVLGALTYGGAKWYLHREVGQAMDTGVLMISPYANVEYDGVSSTMSGKLTVDGVRIRVNGFRDQLYIRRIGINTPSFFSLLKLDDLMSVSRSGDDGMPEYFGFIVDGIRAPVTADYYQTLYQFGLDALDAQDSDEPATRCVGKYGFSPETLTALGYDEQVLSVSMIMRHEESRYLFDIQSDMDDMWDLDASIALAGNMAAEISKGSAYRPRLSTLRIEFTDRSLNERVRKHCTQLGLTPEETLQAQLDAFNFFGKTNGIVFDEFMLDPYREFLGGKSTLIVSAQPSEPVNLSRIGLYKPTDVPALLNLSATVR
jgi:hypothetical protein